MGNFCWACFFLEHLVYAQYTVTSTLLAATASFLFYTTKSELSPMLFIKKNIPAVLLVWTAYLIRSEMLLLVLPMICVAGVAKWSGEKGGYTQETVFAGSEGAGNGRRILTKENVIKYFGTFGLILLGILLGQAVHMLAYGSSEWKAFTEFFDNRTELYDFQKPPVYEGNEEFYERIGITESERILFDNLGCFFQAGAFVFCPVRLMDVYFMGGEGSGEDHSFPVSDGNYDSGGNGLWAVEGDP